MKRVIDIVSALSGLVFLSPILLLIVAAIAWESRGPVVFRQIRIGRNNRRFTIYKFRTMRTDSPNLPTDRLQNPHQYITRVGRFLRKSSLDELPQLFNILTGDMSLVGPRPALYNQDRLIQLRTERNIHLMRPGLTGWAQINGRDDVTDEEKVELDCYYNEHKTVALDLYILLRTFGAVSTAKGVKA